MPVSVWISRGWISPQARRPSCRRLTRRPRHRPGERALRQVPSAENALLYARVQEFTEELKRANADLETAVALRTEELSAANVELKRQLSERAALEEEIRLAH